MNGTRSSRRATGGRFPRVVFAVGAALCTALALGLTGAMAAGPNVPYELPVTLPTTMKTSPDVSSAAPYTPVVLSLIAQLETPTVSGSPTRAQLTELTRVMRGGGTTNLGGGDVTNCKTTGPITAPAGTTPAISPQCWTDAQGVLNTNGPNQRGSTAPMTLMGLAASFDTSLGNVWGQTEGLESREFNVTGLYGPQTDIDRQPNWGRNLTTTGEDPFLSYQMVSTQINGLQGVGTMSQMKHFGAYNGQGNNAATLVQDQAMHEVILKPFEGGFVGGKAAATMCAYQLWGDPSSSLPSTVSTLTETSPFSSGTSSATTWPLSESHFSCEQPVAINYALRDLWGSSAFVATDYGAAHSTSQIFQGTDQEMPNTNLFYSDNTDIANAPGSFVNGGGPATLDQTGSTCADSSFNWISCAASGAHTVGGIPNNYLGSGGSGCTKSYGCALVDAVAQGNVPLSVLNQSLARILYQQERFGLLGCTVTSSTCANPGGIAGDRSGTVNLPEGPTSGSPTLGTKNGDAAIVEKYSEEGAALLKNDGNALPLTSADLSGGVLVTGSSANHLVADPTGEASTGYIGRDAINPLQQLKALSGNPGAFTYVAANDPDGTPIPASALSTTPNASGLGGLNLSVDGGAPTKDTNPIDHTATNGNQLAPGHTYTWSGYLFVPTSDTYTFAVQQSATLPTTLNCPQTGQFGTPPSSPTLTLCSPFTAANASQTNTPADAVSFSFNGAQRNLNATTAVIYGATVPSNPTTAGYTDQGLISRTCATGTAPTEPGTTNCGATESNLTGGTYYPISVTINNTTNCVSTPPAAAVTTGLTLTPAVPAVSAPCVPASFRLAVTQANGDIAAAAAAAAGKSKAIVFVNTGSGASSSVTVPGTAAAGTLNGHTLSGVEAMSAANVNLITAVAAANPNTIVVINNDNPVDTSWSGSAKAILDMWFAGQEGGTSTARILLGQANPSGHTALTWPANRLDTIWSYNETVPLYPGEPAAGPYGMHLERLNANGGCSGTAVGSDACPAAGGTTYSEGIFTGYRFFDKEGITPAFPFGWGLSYTSFDFSKLKLKPTDDNGVDVSFTLKNTGSVAGADAVQVYVGPPSDAPAGVQFAVRSLAQFDRVELAPGESTEVKLHIGARQLSYWSEGIQRWVNDPDGRTVFVGDADALASLPLQDSLKAPKKDKGKGKDNVTCSNEQLNATLIDGDLNVKKGDWCDLVSVTVNGNVHLDQASGVRIENSTINGDLNAEKTTGAGDPMSSGANVICNTTITGHVNIHKSDSGAPWHIGACGPTKIGKNVEFNENSGTGNTITRTTIGGDLKCEKNADVSGSGNTVAGKREKQCASL